MNAPLDAAVRAHLERALSSVSLDDKYTLERGRAFMSGTQALVRLAMLQRDRDRAAGLNTAGFISGYRGSPLGALDQALWKAKAHLGTHGIHFQPGLNEDLAATSVWGTQQVGLSGTAKVDGVFGMWYGKGPGVDRSCDVFKHANNAGTARHGGVLVLAGDDHGAKSSTVAHQSDHIFKACGMPLLYPATVQEYLDLGLHGWAMSRWSGLWVGMKVVTDVVEASASVDIDPDRVRIVLPDDFAMPPDDPNGLNIRWPDTALEQEARLTHYKWYAALAYVRANRLNRIVVDSPDAWFGIITAGKAYLDTMQALDLLGLDAAACARMGIRVYKCGCVWPLEAAGVEEFAEGLDEILVVEEKRQILEYQIKEELYNWPDARRPRVYGKFDEQDGRGGEWAMPRGQWLLPATAELSPALIARAIAARLLNAGQHASRFGGALPEALRRTIESRLEIIEARDQMLALPRASVQRKPTFCSGCPHNTSTHVPEGSRAVAGIGCHYMTVWMPERRTTTFTQMGGEGNTWIGQAPFVTDQHVFANLGDGTYFHSGLLAVRAAIAAGVNITYKILYNDAVAMTGGQPVDGTLTVPMIVAQMRGEGARRIVVVTDQPERYESLKNQPDFRDVEIHHRDHLDWVQRMLREIPGCTVLVYDQTCASEKRRRRKKIVNGQPAFPDPPRRLFINERVCEGCGDCTVQSACVSVEPIETEYGRKRRINQSSCNKDYSCAKGFCPSFVTVQGGTLRRRRPGAAADAATGAPASAVALPAHLTDLPEPDLVPIVGDGERSDRVYGVLVTGVGGTGVVTIGQLLGMAAHLEGRGVSVLDMAGLAQKGGAVHSHVQIAAAPSDLHATRIATGEADLVLGCDLVVTAGNDALAKMRPRLTRGVINTDVAPTSDFLRNPDWQLPGADLRQRIEEAAGLEDLDFIAATPVAAALLGDTIYTNPLVLGYAYQKGWLPISGTALQRAIELNAAQVARNLEAFAWGRRMAVDAPAVLKLAGVAGTGQAGIVSVQRPTGSDAGGPSGSGARADEAPGHVQELDALIAGREAELTQYQSARWAARWRTLVDRVRAAESKALAGTALADTLPLTGAVARYFYKLMAYKDEYEVARLYADPSFIERIQGQFEGDWTLQFHLAPPLLSRTDPRTGRPVKRTFGPRMLQAMGWLARLRVLRGTPLDPFGWQAERRVERALIGQYEERIGSLIEQLTPENHALLVRIASVPEHIRGYGPVKERHLAEAGQKLDALMGEWGHGPQPGAGQPCAQP